MARALKLADWAANQLDPALRYANEMIDTLEVRLKRLDPAPLLGSVPPLDHATAALAAPYLSLKPLGF